ncbi:hypothetical protein ACFQMM_19725 [Saliphagus sp. GCM10025308]
MSTLAFLTFGCFALGASALVFVLVANLEPQPEYPPIMTTTMRIIGGLIALSGGVLGFVFLGYAFLSYTGL